MRENLIKTIQRFINSPFRHSDLVVFLDKQKDFLLQPNVIDKADELEYNSLWDVICDIEVFLNYGKSERMAMACEISVLKLYDDNYKQRKLKLKQQ